jgi:hypothetical protein
MDSARPPWRKPFTPEERQQIDQAIRDGRIQRIEAGGWSLSRFGALLTWRELIDRDFAIRMGQRKR